MLNGDWVSANPLTFNLSAVFKNDGSCSWETLTSPAYLWKESNELSVAGLSRTDYMNSKIACKWLNETSLRMMMGCLLGFSSRRVLKYGLQADRTILWALHVWPSQASVTWKKFVKSRSLHIFQLTSVKLFSSRKCLNDDTMLFWKSFHFKKNCCSPIFSSCIVETKIANQKN